MSKENISNLLETAKNAAVAAGKIHAEYFETGMEIGEKSGSNDLVTNADYKSEAKIVEVIRESFRVITSWLKKQNTRTLFPDIPG